MASTDPFETVRMVGLALPDVEATTKYDGSPVLKLGGCFMAGLATHRSAEPETYYLTDYYRRYPVMLVRLARIEQDALRDVLSVSWRLTLAKARSRRKRLPEGRRHNI